MAFLSSVRSRPLASFRNAGLSDVGVSWFVRATYLGRSLRTNGATSSGLMSPRLASMRRS